MTEHQLVAGLHSVRTALKHGSDSVAEVWVEKRRKDRRIKEVIGLARELSVTLHQVPREELDNLVPGANHQGAVARTLAPTAMDEKDLKGLLSNIDHPPFLLILDGVQDPHNLGACLRSAEAAGVDAVVAPKDRSCGLTPVACKVASGAAEILPFVQVTNLSRTLKWLQDEFRIWLVGTEEEAETALYDADLKGPLGIVMGGEEKGMRRLTGEQCDLRASLPMAGSVESLNVSVAAGICLFEAVRQRH
ncbi:MAG: 23S rRNA (guanosine(2251)-2'-O)-methyltransferase RlmB [Sedimenticola sp.]